MFGGCTTGHGYYQDRFSAEAAVETLHRLFNEGSYDAIYDLGSSEFRSNVSRDQIVSAVSQTAHEYGRLLTTKQAAASCFPSEVRLVYLSSFEKKQATEVFVWHLRDGKASLTLYSVSPGLATIPEKNDAKCS